MYIITNRALKKSKTLRAFGKTPSAKGPNELRLVNVEKSGSRWKVGPVDDVLSESSVKALKTKFKLDIDVKETWYGSLKVACELFERAQTDNKPIVIFIHGYNNDVSDVVEAAHQIESIYDVIVVPFTWPANGGGAVAGAASYLSDKSDARASAGALNRVIGKIQYFHLLLTEAQKHKCLEAALKKHPNNPSAVTALYTKLIEKKCSVKINLLCHSMGNYVLKHTFSTSQNMTSKLVFDNVCLVAADTNNENHVDWVGQLDSRKRVYVVINENDAALKASRIKPGDEQKARLGHYIKKLNSPNVNYIDVTGVKDIGSEHTYFKGDAIANSQALSDLFKGMFSGDSIDDMCTYHTDNNSYTLG